MVRRIKALLLNVAVWVRYLYFLRIPLLGWITLPALCILDWKTGLSALTRGILTMSNGWQAFYSGFFVTCLGMTVLVCARNIVRNGEARFDVVPPAALSRIFCGKKEDWTAILLAQSTAFLSLLYIACITIAEKERHFGVLYWKLWVCLAAGFTVNLLFWYLITLFYLWNYQELTSSNEDHPSPLIFPFDVPYWKQAQSETARTGFARFAEAVAEKVFLVVSSGYKSKANNGQLLELHFLTAVALAAFFLLYLMLYPLTAPVYFSSGYIDAGGAVILFLLCIWGSIREKGANRQTETDCQPDNNPFDPIGWVFLGIMLVLLVVFLEHLHSIASNHIIFGVRTFPTLAAVLVILIFLQWLLSGVTFFLDRYRVPVLTALFFFILIPKLFSSIDQDHYFDIVPASYYVDIPQPLDAMKWRDRSDDAPSIIVTATGGGIQAAAWTSEVMAELEEKFQSRQIKLGDGTFYTFHDHLLLASGVSGGSVGLMPFLLEYTADQPFNTADTHLHDRLTRPSTCSSLEAVAWGLEYFDLQRLVLPWRPAFHKYRDEREYPNRKGKPLPFIPDRTWALTRALNRNLSDPDSLCNTADERRVSGLQDAEDLTLAKSANLLKNGKMPAFTFNTTVAETGGRFLLSNYMVPRLGSNLDDTFIPNGKTDFMPAESFLHVYQQESACDAASPYGDCYLDIALSTAARLSATFPIVSSGTRIPKSYATTAAHFLDGGYYDNDGTASVTEFLYSALNSKGLTDMSTVQPQNLEKSSNAPRKILLIEIRDGRDINPASNPDDWKHQTGKLVDPGSDRPDTWGLGHQILAPLLGLWNAGHVSTTLRNRQQLCLLEEFFAPNLEIHHVVLSIPPAPVLGHPDRLATPPLSWKLTEGQIGYIHDWVSGNYQEVPPRRQTQSAIKNAIDWVQDSINSAKQARADTKPSAVVSAPGTSSDVLNRDATCRLVPQPLSAPD